MTLETFLENFDRLADTPDSVAKMRNLILQLAVTGRLVLYNAADEPASILLENLQTQRSALVSNRRIKARLLEPVRAGEQPFEVPLNWSWARLADVGHELGQEIPSTRFTYIDVGSIDSQFGRIDDDTQVLTAKDAPSRARKIVERGTVIYSTVRPYLLNIAVIDRDIDPEPIASTAFGILHPFAGMSARYLFYWLRSALFTAYVESEMKGMAYPAINDERFYAGYIPVPPSAEQERIVAKVDELMALCDRLEAQQKEREVLHVALNRAAIARFDEAPTPPNLNLLFDGSYTIAPTELRKVILNLAIQGKLVEQNPEDVPAVSTFKKLAGYAIDIAENELPAQWMLVPLGKMGEWRGGGTPSKSNAEFWAGEIPWVSPKDMKVLRIADSEDHISEAAIRSSSVKMIPTGSVLMVVRGMILARAFPVALTLRDVTINQDMKSLFPLEQETRDFLLITLRAMEATILSAVERSSHGTCKLRTEILESIQIPIPPLAEQLRICAKVDRLMKLVDQLEARLTASAETGIELLEAVVHELLRAAANVIEFPSSEPNQASRRAAVGCYAIEHLVRNPSFGRTMLMKVCYLSETHLDVPLGWKPMRQAAGPYDPEIETLELSGTRNGWFTVTEKALSSGRSKYEYLVKDRLKAKAAEAISVLGERKAEFDRLLSLFAEKSTEEAEIIATLFAAWNDLLIDGMSPSGNDIIREVRENWHPQKERFSASLLQQWLDWMRRNRLIPKGCGPRTIQQLKLALK
jgi:type I restriction enzyme S subunit